MNHSQPHLKSNNSVIADLYSNQHQQISNQHQQMPNQYQQMSNQQPQIHDQHQQTAKQHHFNFQYGSQQGHYDTQQKTNFFTNQASRLLNNNYDTMDISSNMTKIMEENAQLKQHLMIKDSELSRMNLEVQHLHSKTGTFNEDEKKKIEEHIREEMKEKLQKAANEIDTKMKEYKKTIGEQEVDIDSLSTKNHEFLVRIQELEQSVNFNIDSEDWASGPKVEQLLQSHKQKWEEKIRVILAETLIQKENEYNAKYISLEEFIDLQKQENEILKSSNEKIQEKIQISENSNSKNDEKYENFVNEIKGLQEELTFAKNDNSERLNQEKISLNEHFNTQVQKILEQKELEKQEIIRVTD